MIETIKEMEELFPDGQPGSKGSDPADMAQKAMAGWNETLKALADTQAENERLQRVVEQAIKLADIDFMGHDLYSEQGHACAIELPDLYAHLKREDGNG